MSEGYWLRDQVRALLREELPAVLREFLPDEVSVVDAALLQQCAKLEAELRDCEGEKGYYQRQVSEARRELAAEQALRMAFERGCFAPRLGPVSLSLEDAEPLPMEPLPLEQQTCVCSPAGWDRCVAPCWRRRRTEGH